MRLKLALLGPGLVAALDGDPAAAADGGDVERVRAGEPMCGLPSRLNRMRSIAFASVAVPTVERGSGAHPLLVDDDRRRQPVEHVDLGPRQGRHEALDEGAVGLVDQPLRLGGDRAEHERALARARDPGEDRQPALRELDADVLEVVDARAVHADQVVAVGRRAPGAAACPCSAAMVSALPGCGAGCPQGRGRRSRGRRTAGRSAPARPRRRRACSRSNVPSTSSVARLIAA